MKTKHTPEPWGLRPLFESPILVTYDDGQEGYTNEISVIDNTGRIIAEVCYATDSENMGWGQNETVGKWEANAARIVDCVNACAGMDDPAKEIAEMKAELNRLKEKQ